MKLSREYDLPGFCSMLDGCDDPGIVVDWMSDAGMCQTHRPEIMADVCLLYARDKGACEGLHRWECPRCNKDIGHLGLFYPGNGIVTHEECGWSDDYRCAMYDLTPLLPTDFPQAVFAEWALRVFGTQVPDTRIVKDDAVVPLGDRWIGQENGPGGWLYISYGSKPNAIRSVKRRTLALLPVTYKATWRGRGFSYIGQRQSHVDRFTLDGREFIGTPKNPIDVTTDEHGWHTLTQSRPVAELVPDEPLPDWLVNAPDARYASSLAAESEAVRRLLGAVRMPRNQRIIDAAADDVIARLS